MNQESREVGFRIIEQIGVLKEEPDTGWKKELNKISWNLGEPVYDIRMWSSDHRRMSRGITLSESEMGLLLSYMQDRNKGKISLDTKISEAGEQQKKQDHLMQSGQKKSPGR